MFYHRGFCHDVEALHFKVIMLCVVFYLLIFGPCIMTGTLNPTGYDEYGYDGVDLSLGSDDVLVGDSRKRILSLDVKLENVCRRSDMFCFPSTLSGVKVDETIVGTDELGSSNHGNFQLINGNVVSCSLEVKESGQDTFDSSNENDTPFVRIKSSSVNDFSSVDVQISHPLLDWGRKYLHVPSLISLTVENRHKSRVLNVYEPYSTNKQFYPCNYSEVKLGPGEVASICFVFLPKRLGLSSGHLILQTSSGGFLVRAQGFGVEPPYMIQSSIGSGPRVVSVFNPSDKVLHLEEVSAWISFSSGNVSYLVSGVCSVMDYMSSSDFDVNEWLDVKISQVGQPVMAVRPQKTWSIGSNSIQPILELDFPYNFQATIYGSFCVHILNNDLEDSSCTSILEANLGRKSRSYTSETHLSVSLNLVMPTDANEIASVSLLVKNDGPDLVTVVNISAVGEHAMFLETKYVEGLILFPHTMTQVAMVTYTSNPFMNLNCSLLVQTNKSSAPALEVYCNDIASLCSRLHSYAGYRELKNDNAAETRSSNVHLQPPEIKAKEMTTADESVLRNWISQGTSDAMSVLDDHEVMFSMVRIGTHQSKWISVVNPSDQPVVMQLLLNSGEIINECHGSEEILQHSSSYYLVLNNHMNPPRFGFSIPQNAVTEAYVHPHGEAVLGPIVFHPSSRCAWKSSALVRNNLSGVEWLSLSGSGGLVSLMLLDGADPVHTIELKHNYGQPSMKILLAKNTGDLPLKVNGITISGTKCELDGFAVGNCKGFSLQPGESRKLMISYRANICAEMVRRELELAMAGGILVVPMEVSLPTPTVTICKRSLFWTRFKKLILAALVLLLPVFLVCSCSFSFIVRGGNLPKAHSSDAYLKPKTVKVVVASSPPVPLPSQLSSSMTNEVSRSKNLTVKTGKDNARLRKKKRNSGLGITGLYEVSSSHSSTSTPSSPLSPASSSTPKRSPQLSPSQNIQSRNLFNHSSASAVLAPKNKSYTPPKDKPSTPPKHKPSTPHKDKPRTPPIDKPRTLPICTPPKDKLCTPPIDKPRKPPKTTALFALAPGANRKDVKHEKISGNGDRFEYKVWDRHLQLRCPGSFEVQDPCMPTIAEDNHFSSFFSMNRQEFFRTSLAEIIFDKKLLLQSDLHSFIEEVEEVAKALTIIRAEGPSLGLKLNIKKTEVFWPSCNGLKVKEGLFPSEIGRPDRGVKLLGGAVSRDGVYISKMAVKRASCAVDLMRCLPQLRDPQSELLLLRSCMGVAKMLFGLRTCQPSFAKEAVSLFDIGLRSAIEDIVVCGGPHFGDLQWRMASLPIRFGGLGLLKAEEVSTYAFVASRAQSWKLQDHILRDSGVTGLDSDYEQVLRCLHVTLPDLDLGVFSNKDTAPPKSQQILASALYSKTIKNLGSVYDLTPRQNAVLECLQGPHAQDFLSVLPIEGLR